MSIKQEFLRIKGDFEAYSGVNLLIGFFSSNPKRNFLAILETLRVSKSIRLFVIWDIVPLIELEVKGNFPVSI